MSQIQLTVYKVHHRNFLKLSPLYSSKGRVFFRLRCISDAKCTARNLSNKQNHNPPNLLGVNVQFGSISRITRLRNLQICWYGFAFFQFYEVLRVIGYDFLLIIFCSGSCSRFCCFILFYLKRHKTKYEWLGYFLANGYT